MAQHKKGEAGVPDGPVNSTAEDRMGRSRYKNRRRKDSKKGFKRELLYH